MQHNAFATIGTQNVGFADTLFALSVAKRQMQIVRDLMSLNETYPELIDKQLVGGLFALGTWLEDAASSIGGGAASHRS